MMTRRRFLKIATITTASGVAAAGVVNAGPRRVRMTRHQVAWPRSFRLRVAHLTDLHAGRATSDRLLEQSVQICLAARPDLVALTGDFVNHSLGRLPGLSRLIARLPRPCVATLGNHDHWSGADAVQAALERQGVVVLRNERARVRAGTRRVTVVGVDDGYTRHDDVDRAFDGLRRPGAALVLSHFPNTADEIAARGGRVVLSGHTHGGQVQIPHVTRAIARLAGNRYLTGWYAVGQARLFVNAGIGSSVVRLRVGARAQPEVAIIDLVPERRSK